MENVCTIKPLRWSLLLMLAFAFSAIILCERNMTPVTPGKLLRTVTLVIADGQNKRAGEYRVEAHGANPSFYIGCLDGEPCFREILRAEDLPETNEDWQDIAALDFSRYAYDLVVLAVPDPAHYSQLINKSWGDGKLTLEFGIYHSPWRGPVPMVLVSEWYLFRYPR